MNFYQFRDKVQAVYQPLFDPTIDGEHLAHLLAACRDDLIPIYKELTGRIDLLATDDPSQVSSHSDAPNQSP